MANTIQEQILKLPDDYEGRAVAVLTKIKSESASKKGTLYIHGFNDYFFQTEMAERFNREGYNFYALDLRRYGRALLPHQTFNDIRDLKMYFREILDAIKIMKTEGNSTILLGGHSTGGLIITLFCQDYWHLIQGVWMNSPFFEFNKSYFTRKIAIPCVALIGKRNPSKQVPGGFSKQYGISLHKSEKGEWDYDLRLKPHVPPSVSAGWIRAIYEGHQRLDKGVYIGVPVLILHSAKSANVNSRWSDRARNSDIILNVKSIERKSEKLDGKIELVAIKGGMHDLFLSALDVREDAFSRLFDWTKRYFS